MTHQPLEEATDGDLDSAHPLDREKAQGPWSPGRGRDGPEDQAVVTAALPVPRRAGVAGAGRPSMGPASPAVTRGIS